MNIDKNILIKNKKLLDIENISYEFIMSVSNYLKSERLLELSSIFMAACHENDKNDKIKYLQKIILYYKSLGNAVDSIITKYSDTINYYSDLTECNDMGYKVKRAKKIDCNYIFNKFMFMNDPIDWDYLCQRTYENCIYATHEKIQLKNFNILKTFDPYKNIVIMSDIFDNILKYIDTKYYDKIYSIKTDLIPNIVSCTLNNIITDFLLITAACLNKKPEDEINENAFDGYMNIDVIDAHSLINGTYAANQLLNDSSEKPFYDKIMAVCTAPDPYIIEKEILFKLMKPNEIRELNEAPEIVENVKSKIVVGAINLGKKIAELVSKFVNLSKELMKNNSQFIEDARNFKATDLNTKNFTNFNYEMYDYSVGYKNISNFNMPKYTENDSWKTELPSTLYSDGKISDEYFKGSKEKISISNPSDVKKYFDVALDIVSTRNKITNKINTLGSYAESLYKRLSNESKKNLTENAMIYNSLYRYDIFDALLEDGEDAPDGVTTKDVEDDQKNNTDDAEKINNSNKTKNLEEYTNTLANICAKAMTVLDTMYDDSIRFLETVMGKKSKKTNKNK